MSLKINIIIFTIVSFVFSCKNESKGKNIFSIEKAKNDKMKEDKIYTYKFKNLVIKDWNIKTSEMINFYSFKGEDGEEPMKMMWETTNNGAYRKLLFDSLNKCFPEIKLGHTTFIKELFLKGRYSKVPKQILIMNEVAKFHACVYDLTYNNYNLNFEIDTTLLYEDNYEKIYERLREEPSVLKITTSMSDHMVGQHALEIYTKISDNHVNLFFDYDIDIGK